MPDDPTSGGTSRGEVRSLSALVGWGSFWTLVGRFGHSIVMLLGTVVLARLLTPADFGVVAIVVAVSVLTLVAVEGLIDTPIQRVNELTDARARSLVWLGFGVVIGAAILTAIAAMPLERLFALQALGPSLLALIPVFFLQVVSVAGRAHLRRNHAFKTIGRVVWVSAIVYVAAAIPAALAGWGHWALIAGLVTSNFAMAVQFATKARLALAPPKRIDLGETAIVGRDGFIARTLAWFWSSIDTLAVGLTASATQVGLYSRAYNLSTQAKEPFAAIDHPIRQALIATRERGGDVGLLGIKLLRLVTLATSLVAAIIILLREEIVWLLLGPQWAEAALPLAILVAALPARIALNLLDSVIIATGEMKAMVRRHAFMAVIIGVGIATFAEQGIIVVAMVVTTSLYASLLLVALLSAFPRERLIAAIGALIPGLLTGGVTVIGLELMRRSLGLSVFLEIVSIAVLMVVLTTLWTALLPDKWTFLAYRNLRAKCLNKFR